MTYKQQDLASAISSKLDIILKDTRIRDEIVDYLANGDFLNSNATEIETIEALGGYDEFSITIYEAFGIYWITATEFDEIGYFDSLEVAIDHAKDEYEPYITALKELEEEEEEEYEDEDYEEEEEQDEDEDEEQDNENDMKDK